MDSVNMLIPDQENILIKVRIGIELKNIYYMQMKKKREKQKKRRGKIHFLSEIGPNNPKIQENICVILESYNGLWYL